MNSELEVKQPEGETLAERAAREGVTGFIHPVELFLLCQMARGKRVLEIGAFMGLSAWAMAQGAKSVCSVDTFRANTDGQGQAEHLTTLRDYITAVRKFTNTSYIVGTSEQAEAQIGNGMFDMIFLDAMHTYEDVRDDINRWWPHLEEGGVMAFHDYRHDHFPGVQQAVEERFGRLPNHVVTLGWLLKCSPSA